MRGSLQGLAGRLGPLGTALTALGPAGLAAGAALAGVGLVLTRGLQEAAQADQSYRRLEAVLRATGQASGLTASEITGFADGLERSTLATAESVQDAASVLATFRSVAGDTFTRALTLAQDLSAVFGQDLSASATQLGKALEEPVQGITALRRVGVSFTATQRELIASLVETGQTAQAQKVILDALEQQVGGAGAAEAGGLTGPPTGSRMPGATCWRPSARRRRSRARPRVRWACWPARWRGSPASSTSSRSPSGSSPPTAS